MPAEETGGWDLVVEVATTALERHLDDVTPHTLPATPVSNSAFQGTVHPVLQPVHLSLDTHHGISIEIALDGTRLRIEHVTMPIGGTTDHLPDSLAEVRLSGRIRLTDTIEMQPTTHDVVIDFDHDDAEDLPQAETTLESDSLLAAPVAQFVLAEAFLTGGEVAYNETSRELLESVQMQIGLQVLAAIAGLHTIPIIPAPRLAISAADLKTDPPSLHACYALCNPPGRSFSIRRSMLLTTSAGSVADVAAIAVSNEGLLGCFIRPEIQRILQLPSSGFRHDHPCEFVGSSRLPGVNLEPWITETTTDSLITGLDENGLLRIVAHFTAHGIADAFSIRCTADVALSIGAEVTSGGRLSITPTLAHTPTAAVDIEVAPWVYVVGLLVFFPAIGPTAFADLFGATLLDGPIAGLVSRMLGMLPSVALPLPDTVRPVRVRATTSAEPGAPRRTLTIPPGPDPFPSNDLIVNLI
ncbi:MAG: hypothetical protein ACTHN3_06045 [Solirubrobacterales bacterium]